VSTPPRLEQLDRRPTGYRFDPDRDVAWSAIDAPGAYAGPHLLSCLGVRTDALSIDETAFDVAQWAFGVVIAQSFVALERDVTAFVQQLPEPTRSAALLVEEEVKHAALFERYARHLRDARPDLTPTLDAMWRPPVSWSSLAAAAEVDDEHQLRFLIWLATLFFEEFTVWIHAALEVDAEIIQPTWLSLHDCHRREELQHVLTDAAYLDRLPVDELSRTRLARAFQGFLESHVDRLLGIDVYGELVEALIPGLDPLVPDRRLRARPLLHELLHHPAFRFTRAFLPSLNRMTEWPPRAAALLSGPSTPLEPPATLVGCLRRAIRANSHGGIVYVRNDGAERSCSYPELLARAERRLAGLQARGLKQGDTVLLVTLDPEQLVPTWWACVLGGIVPAPIAPPASHRDIEAEVDRLFAIHASLGGTPVLTDAALTPVLRNFADARGVTLDLITVSTLDDAPLRLQPANLHPDDVAFVQFSSGSTSNPRGIRLTHRNLISTARGMLQHRGGNLHDTFVSWLPLVHDMGLIGYHLAPLIAAARQVLLTPAQFMADPLCWPRALARHGGTITGGPLFALRHLLNRTQPGALDGLELGRVHCWLVGAEPLSFDVIERASELLATVGLPRTALCPGYGLAEATLAVTMTGSRERAQAWKVDRDSVGEGRLVTPSERDDAVLLVDCGAPIPNVELRVVDIEHLQLPEDHVGRIQVRGPTVTPGLHGESQPLGPGHGWLDTGDLGVVHDGRLYVTGRTKDVFFSGGRTMYTHDIELVVGELPLIRPGGVALVVHPANPQGVERRTLAIVPARGVDVPRLLDQAARHLAARCGVGVDEVIAVERSDLPRTTSGKLQRHRLGEHLRAGHLDHRERLLHGAVPQPRVRPSDGMIGLVRRTWAEVLQLDPGAIGLDDDFHALGGHSLLAAEVHARLEDLLGRHLGPELLQSGATVREMAAWLTAQVGAATLPPRARPAAPPADDTSAAPAGTVNQPVAEAHHAAAPDAAQTTDLASDHTALSTAPADPVAAQTTHGASAPTTDHAGASDADAPTLDVASDDTTPTTDHADTHEADDPTLDVASDDTTPTTDHADTHEADAPALNVASDDTTPTTDHADTHEAAAPTADGTSDEAGLTTDNAVTSAPTTDGASDASALTPDGTNDAAATPTTDTDSDAQLLTTPAPPDPSDHPPAARQHHLVPAPDPSAAPLAASLPVPDPFADLFIEPNPFPTPPDAHAPVAHAPDHQDPSETEPDATDPFAHLFDQQDPVDALDTVAVQPVADTPADTVAADTVAVQPVAPEPTASVALDPVADIAEPTDALPAADPTPAALPHATAQPTTADPIAVVGLAVRFPGAADPAALWALLTSGADALSAVPADRFDPDTLLAEPVARRLSTLRGAFLADLTQFDPAPFDLRDEVARALDPHQRLMLELCLEALTQASCPTRRVGVFAAAGDNEYALRYHDDPTLVGPHALLGSLRNVVASRVASTFGLTGPALAVDTACSSSLTAVHLATAALRRGDCDLALAGGVQLNLTDRVWRSFASAGLLCPDGQSRPFDADARGLVPGEGGAVVLLKPLAAALADGDDIWGLLRGSAVNNDGGALSGTAPNPAGQREVMRQAWADAGCATSTASYVEAHAAGTALGDALEAHSLAEVFADTGGLWVGSVKSQLGHTFAASGVASLAKVLLALRHELLPPTIGCAHPSPRAGFAPGGVQPLTTSRPWPRSARPRRAGIDSFGLGGTNVHLVVEEAPAPVELPWEPGAVLLPLAGPHHALPHHAAALHGVPGARNARARDAARRAAWGRSRCALVVPWDQPLDDALARLRDGTLPEQADPIRRLAFVLPGPGSQRPGMARELRQTEPQFAEAWARCRLHLRARHVDLDALADATDLDRIDIAQVVVFCFGYAASVWLSSLGVRPDLLIGHSAGELLAAQLAGCLTLPEALDLVLARATAMSKAPEGGMIAAFASPEQVDEVLRALDLPPALAAHNAPSQTVLSGPDDLLTLLLRGFEIAEIPAKRLPVQTPAHSAAMAPVAEALNAAAADLPARPARLPWISTVDARTLPQVDAAYWARQVVEPVRFVAAVQAALEQGVDGFLELGATSGLTTCVEAIAGRRATAIALCERDQHEQLTALRALADLWTAGRDVRLDRLSGTRGGHASPPPWPWRRRRLWIDPPAHIGPRVRTLRYDDLPCVQDHQTAGLTTAPAALLIDHLLREQPGPTVGLSQLLNRAPLALGPGSARRLCLETGVHGELSAWSTSAAGERAVLHLTAQRLVAPRRTFAQLDLDASRARCTQSVPAEAIYQLLASTGFEVGPRMRAVQAAWAGEDEVIAELRTPAGGDRGRWIDPALLDGASHALAARLVGRFSSSRPFLGFTIGSLALWQPVRGACTAVVQLRSALDPHATVLRYDLWLTAPDGTLLAEARDVTARRADALTDDPVDVEPLDQPTRLALPLPSEAPPRRPRSLLRAALSEAPPPPPPPRPNTHALELLVREVIAARLRRSPDSLPLNGDLAALGLDSIKAVELAATLEARLGVHLPATLLFEVRTLAGLLDRLREHTGPHR
jgi:acyl transferase domain-containing protein/acyl-CoA synthetase (AMP-forming)/AMP-acid ligase II/acyl carrier protein